MKYNSKGRISEAENKFGDFLKTKNIRFEAQKRFRLQDGFEFKGVRYKPIDYVADFYLLDDDIAIDYKGMPTADFKIKMKMFIKVHQKELLLVREAPEYIKNIFGAKYIELGLLENFTKIKKENFGKGKLDISQKSLFKDIILNKFEIKEKYGMLLGGKK